ncbi:MAG: tetratricopeptide repeat protein [Chitinophagaceae bacterium]
MKIFSIIAFLCFTCLFAPAQEADKIIEKGNELYKQKQYDRAELAYKEALDKEKENTTAKFNQANALYRQSKQVESVKALEELVMNAKEADLKAKGYYNKGVIFSSQKRLEESIEAYKSALRQNPEDKETRENLQKALMELKKKTPPPPPPPKKDDKKKDQQKQQQKQQQPQMNQKEAEQRLKLLEQKEKELQERLQKEKSKGGGGGQKDW